MSDGSSTPPDPTRPGSPPPPPPGFGVQPPPPPFGQQPYEQSAQYGQQARPGGAAPPNYLVWAILSTIFCCLPLGVVSIVYAAQVNSKYSAGDITGAQSSSDKAKQFAILSAIIGVIVTAIFIAVSAAGG